MKKLLTFFGIMSLFVFSACSTQNVNVGEIDEPEIIKIGIIAPFSGDAAAYGQDIEKVLQYQLEVVNKEAEKKGKKIELVFEDGKCTGHSSVTAIQKLIDLDGIKVVLGGLCSSETLAIAPIADSRGVVLFSAASSNPDVEKQGEYVFSLSYRDDLVGGGLVEELEKYSKIALITEQNDYNVGLRNEVLENISEDVEIVADESFEKGGSDFRNVLEKISNAEPEAIFLNPNAGVTAENLMKQLSEIPDLKDVQLISQVAYLSDGFRSSIKEASEGMIIIDAPKMNSKELLDVIEEVRAGRGEIPTLGNYYTATYLDALNILSNLTIKLGVNPTEIKDELRSDTFKGYLGKIHFGEDNFVQNIPVGKYIVEDGVAVYQD